VKLSLFLTLILDGSYNDGSFGKASPIDCMIHIPSFPLFWNAIDEHTAAPDSCFCNSYRVSPIVCLFLDRRGGGGGFITRIYLKTVYGKTFIHAIYVDYCNTSYRTKFVSVILYGSHQPYLIIF
jgi:hypothetical protein